MKRDRFKEDGVIERLCKSSVDRNRPVYDESDKNANNVHAVSPSRRYSSESGMSHGICDTCTRSLGSFINTLNLTIL